MAHSPHKHRKGCGLCRPWKLRTLGDGERTPFRELRKLGQKRRFTRRFVSEE